MRRATGMALLAALCVGAPTARADDRDRQERKIARLMDELREEMWSYRQELDFFRRFPEYPRLVDLRWELRARAIRVVELEEGGPRAQRLQAGLAREMEETARELKRLTGILESHTDLGAPPEIRKHADRLKARADEIRKHIGRLRDVVRDDRD